MHRSTRLLALPLLLVLSGFTRPFTPVQNVCPSCPKPKTDLVKLSSGETLRCKVVARNDDYYVVMRFGELRAVMKDEVTSITWAREGGASKVTTTGDQVLLKNGVVLHGSIAEQQQGRLLVILVGTMRHVVWFGQIQRLHKAGRQQDLGSGTPAPAGTPAPETP